MKKTHNGIGLKFVVLFLPLFILTANLNIFAQSDSISNDEIISFIKNLKTDAAKNDFDGLNRFIKKDCGIFYKYFDTTKKCIMIQKSMSAESLLKNNSSFSKVMKIAAKDSDSLDTINIPRFVGGKIFKWNKKGVFIMAPEDFEYCTSLSYNCKKLKDSNKLVLSDNEMNKVMNMEKSISRIAFFSEEDMIIYFMKEKGKLYIAMIDVLKV